VAAARRFRDQRRCCGAGVPGRHLHVDLPYQLGFHGKRCAKARGSVAHGPARGSAYGIVLPLFVPRDVSPTGPRQSDLEDSYLRVLSELFRGEGLALPAAAPGRACTLGCRSKARDRWRTRPNRSTLGGAGVRIVGLVTRSTTRSPARRATRGSSTTA